MDCVFINLDAAGERRAALEASFAATAPPDWRLSRFSAVDAARVLAESVPGAIPGPAKGCFLSHLRVIASRLGDEAPLFVLEDDARLGQRTGAAVDALVRDTAQDWDLMFTDVCIPEPAAMAELAALRPRLADARQVMLLDLARLPFAGSTAYVVRGSAKAKLHALLSERASLDQPYDLFLAEAIRAGRLKAVCAFPFLTTLSDLADVSAITDEARTIAVWNAFRRLVWAERDLAAETASLERLRAGSEDAGADALGVVLAAAVGLKARAMSKSVA